MLASTTALTLATASPAHADPGCQNGGAYIVWARGSGQFIGDVEAQRFQGNVETSLNAAGIGTHAWAELGNLDGSVQGPNQFPDEPNEYPAVTVSDWHAVNLVNGTYVNSVLVGVQELIANLNHRYTLGPVGMGCNNETVVLGGYSQGADLIGRALALTDGGLLFGYPLPALTPAARSHIGFVAQYGDPELDSWSCPRSQWVRGSVMCQTIGVLGQRAPQPDMVNRTGSWCDQADGICNQSTSLLGSHLTAYRGSQPDGNDGLIHQSAAEIVATARTKRCQLSGLGCPSYGGVGNATFVGGSVLNAGNEIGVNQYLASPDGRFALLFQTDRNVVQYGPSPLWWTGTGGSSATRLVMQTDGNLVLYNGTTLVWQAGTVNSGANRLVVQSDGNVVLYTSSNTPVWWTGTGGYAVTVPRGGYLLGGGQQMDLNQYLQSPDGRITLLLQTDGNLVLYGPGYHVLWQSGTAGQGVSRLSMQTDGNLVLYRANNTWVWQSGTGNSGADRVVVQNDGNLVIYRPNNSWVWQSGTGGMI
jgi:hypothetical protein